MKLIVLIIPLGILTNVMAAQIAIKATAVQFDYMETANGGNLDSEKSDMTKVHGFEVDIRGGSYDRSGVRFINDLEMSYNKGETQYVGSLLGDPNTQYGDVRTITNNRLYEMSYKVGFSLPISQDVSMGGQVGTGVREWKRSLIDGNTETYFWSNWIAGGRMDWNAAQGIEISATADWQKAYKPTMTSTGIGTSFDLGKTSGYKLGLHWVGYISQKLVFEMDYIYDYWKISKSNTVSDGSGNNYYEPDSKTKNQYIKAGFSYLF